MRKFAWPGLLAVVVVALAGCGGGGGNSFGQFDPVVAQARMQERLNTLATSLQQRDVDGVMAVLSPDFKHDGITRQDVKDRLTAAATEYDNVTASFTVKSIRLQGKTGFVTTEYAVAGDVVAEPGTRKTGDGTMEVRWCHELGDWYITGNLQNGSGGPPHWPF